MRNKNRISLAVSICVLFLLVVVFSVPVSAPDGGGAAIWAIQNGLPDFPDSPWVTAFEIPGGAILDTFLAPKRGNGRGIAFDGSTLYYTLYPEPGIIYEMSTDGEDLGSISLDDDTLQLGAITWDGVRGQLWGAAYDGTSRIFTIDPDTGDTTLEFIFLGWMGPESQYPQPNGYMDGLEYSAFDDTLWLSDDAGIRVYNVNLAGAVISWFAVAPLGNTGIVFDGAHLWLAMYDPPNPDVTHGWGLIRATDRFGVLISEFLHDGKLYEDLAGVDTVTFAPPKIPVYVDIKPGGWPNPINMHGKGVLSVAISGTEDFDVMTIDPDTVKINREGVAEGVSPIRWSYEDVATPYTGEPRGGHNLEGDGYLDLTLKFKTQEVIETLGLDAFEGETIILSLNGNLMEEHGGTPIQGQDWIVILNG